MAAERIRLCVKHSNYYSIALPAHSGPRPFIQFCNHISQTVGLLGRVISPPQSRYLNTEQHKYRIIAYPHQTSMPWVGFEPTIPASERAKTVHAEDLGHTCNFPLNDRWPMVVQDRGGPTTVEGLAHTYNCQLNDCWPIVVHDRGGPTTVERRAHTYNFELSTTTPTISRSVVAWMCTIQE
jgi:hypothetical protein